MTTKWDKFSKNNRFVDKSLLAKLGQLTTTTVVVIGTKPSDFAINHPLDSNLFRDAIKDVERKPPTPAYISALANSVRT